MATSKRKPKQPRPRYGETWCYCGRITGQIMSVQFDWVQVRITDQLGDMRWKSSVKAFLQRWTRVEDKP